MTNQENMLKQLQRYYSLWKESNMMYEEWAKTQGLSSNGVLVLYSFYDNNEPCTQKSISQKWSIPKQTVNTILKDFTRHDYIEMISMPEDKRNKLLQLTPAGKEFADTVIKKLCNKEMYVMEKMGLDSITSMNDNLELFINLFNNGGLNEHE
jgi:DNA-binding MarR family transcriptional regulator